MHKVIGFNYGKRTNMHIRHFAKTFVCQTSIFGSLHYIILYAPKENWQLIVWKTDRLRCPINFKHNMSKLKKIRIEYNSMFLTWVEFLWTKYGQSSR
mgnify:CR=1 FL=1